MKLALGLAIIMLVLAPRELTAQPARPFSSFENVTYVHGLEEISRAFAAGHVWPLLDAGTVHNPASPLPDLTEERLQHLLRLKTHLESAGEGFKNSEAAALAVSKTLGGEVRGALVYRDAADLVQKASTAIEAYERAYDQVKNERLRLEARSRTCIFLEKLHSAVTDTPVGLIRIGWLRQASYENGFVKRNGAWIESVASSRDRVCRVLQDVPATTTVSRRSGTAFGVRPDGLLITAYHVVKGAEKVTVTCPEVGSLLAAIDKTSPANDLAVLRVSTPRSLVYLSIGETKRLGIGDPVFTVGYPAPQVLGTDIKFAEGAISAVSGPDGDATFLQLSVPIQPGNSGGPLLTLRGEVVGIIVATADARAFLERTGSLPQNVNWALKAHVASLLFDTPPRNSLPASRDEAIRRAMNATCLVSVEASTAK